MSTGIVISLPLVSQKVGGAGAHGESQSTALAHESAPAGGAGRLEIDSAIAPATARAYARDLEYFWAWVRASERAAEPVYPVPSEWLRAFALAHLAPLDAAITTRLRAWGFNVTGRALSPRTIRRRLASLSVEHSLCGLTNPCRDTGVALLLRRAARRRATRLQQPITAEVCAKLLSVCGSDLRGLRDRALLLVGFAGGGRRRSELAALHIEHLTRVVGGFNARLPVHKTVAFSGELEFPIFGSAALALEAWLEAAGIDSGPLFRGIHRSGRILAALDGRTVNRIIKRRVRECGLRPHEYGAHSLRRGFVTEAGKQGIALGDAMAVSGHRSIGVALGYHRAGTMQCNRAAHLAAFWPKTLNSMPS